MRNLVLLLLTSLVVSSSARAEPPQGLGLHAGFNVADVSTGPTGATGSTLGAIIGATYDYSFAPDLYLVPGMQLSQRGYNFKIGLTDFSLKMTYLEFPIMFQARFHGAEANLVPFFAAGPVMSLKLATSCSQNDGSCTAYDQTAVKTLAMGIEIGGGVIMPLENASLAFQLRYHLGLTRVASDTMDPRHRGVLFQVGYLF